MNVFQTRPAFESAMRGPRVREGAPPPLVAGGEQLGGSGAAAPSLHVCMKPPPPFGAPSPYVPHAVLELGYAAVALRHLLHDHLRPRQGSCVPL